MKKFINKLNGLPLKKKGKVLHISLSELFDYKYLHNIKSNYCNINIIYDNICIDDITHINRKVKGIDSTKLSLDNKLLYQVNDKYYIYRVKSSLPGMYIYIYMLFMVSLIILICIICSSIDNSHVSDYDNLINYTIDSINDKRIDIKSLFNSINKSIPNIYDINKNNPTKSLFIQYNQQNINNRFNESIILNKVKDLHIGEIIQECEFYKNKILQLEMQIHNNKAANSNLIKDLGDIMREFESERKKL